ncbi:MAG: biotin synthase BioB [Myxococcota bacterium]|nr:biotin synthase BioB [Myxococcota bacterium]
MTEAHQLIRTDWTQDEVKDLFEKSYLDLVFQAASVHRHFHDPADIQKCTLVSIKTGACPEDCSYCSQSSRNNTDLEREPLMSLEKVREIAQRAKDQGASRLCMGAAWRHVKGGKDFETVKSMISEVSGMGLETCATLGMVTADQAVELKEAGLHTYNHNLDTSREYYPKVIGTRTYDDRLETLQNVRNAGLKVCCGGILGLGEEEHDRVALLHTLATFDTHPDSVPVNMLVPVKGTPLEDQTPVEPQELIRTIAVARILMPKARVRLSAGRHTLSDEAQALAFLAGANSIFYGDELLTTPNNEPLRDQELLRSMGAYA